MNGCWSSNVTALIPALTPQGHFVLAPPAALDAAAELPGAIATRLEAAFERGPGYGLFELGSRQVGTVLPAGFAYWRDFAARYVTLLSTSAQPPTDDSAAEIGIVRVPDAESLAELANTAPPMPGGEYLNATVLGKLWEQIDAACRDERAGMRQTLQEYLRTRHPAWHLVGRVRFNLAENRADDEAPFADTQAAFSHARSQQTI